jgi:hypothetical protein
MAAPQQAAFDRHGRDDFMRRGHDDCPKIHGSNERQKHDRSPCAAQFEPGGNVPPLSREPDREGNGDDDHAVAKREEHPALGRE